MLESDTIQAPCRKPRNRIFMDLENDTFLMDAIARKRDPEAFEVLFERHRSAAFNLAFAITGRRDRGEDAVQAGMLNVWSRAGSYKPRKGATVRSWLLRVVACDALKLVRKGQRDQAATGRDAENMKVKPPASEVGEALEKQEALVFLRASLTNLPPSDRQLLALAFGADMSTQDIAKELKVSRWTISRRLENLKRDLRSNLKAAGLGAVVSLSFSQEVATALLSGCEPSLDLKQRILSRMGETGNEAQHMASRPTVQATRNVSVYLILAVSCVIVSAGIFWIVSPEMFGSNIRMHPDILRTTKPDPAGLTGDAVRLYWNFKHTDLKANDWQGLQVVQGSFQWRQGDDGASGHMELPRNIKTIWMYPNVPFNRAYVETLNLRVFRKGAWEIGGGWFDGKGCLPKRNIFTRSIQRNGLFRQVRYYTIDRFQLLEVDGKIILMNEFVRVPSGTMRRFQNGIMVTLKSIELRSLEDQEVEKWRTKIKTYMAKNSTPGPWSVEPAWTFIPPPQ